jgi:hypothetical protein
MVRMTIDTPDPLYRRLKSQAAGEGISAKKLILRGVEQILRNKFMKPSRKRVELPIVRSKHPGLLHIDHSRIYDIISFS